MKTSDEQNLNKINDANLDNFISEYKKDTETVKLSEQQNLRIWEHALHTHRQVVKAEKKVFSLEKLVFYLNYLISPPVLKPVAVLGTLAIVSVTTYFIFFDNSGKDNLSVIQPAKQSTNLSSNQNVVAERADKSEQVTKEYLAKMKLPKSDDAFGIVSSDKSFDSTVLNTFREFFKKSTLQAIEFNLKAPQVYASEWLVIKESEDSIVKKTRFLISITGDTARMANIYTESVKKVEEKNNFKVINLAAYEKLVKNLKKTKL